MKRLNASASGLNAATKRGARLSIQAMALVSPALIPGRNRDAMSVSPDMAVPVSVDHRPAAVPPILAAPPPNIVLSFLSITIL